MIRINQYQPFGQQQKERVACSRVVCTMGPWSSQLEKFVPGFSLPMRGIKSTSLVISFPQQIKDNLLKNPAILFCEDDENGCHLELYLRNDGTIYICGVGGSDDIFASDLGPSGKFNEASKCIHKDERISAALKSLENISPTLAKNATVEIRQCCMRPCLPDALPAMGLVKENLFVSAGHNCWGILWAPAQGLLMSELIMTGKTSQSIQAFNPWRYSNKE